MANIFSSVFESISLLFEPLRNSFLWAGFADVGNFLGTHLLSAMIPAFLVAGAIGIFIDKQRIVKYMGPKTDPKISYPVAALSGGILTVCSCGVIPIFTSILNQGAGIGPAFTFLVAAPAVNIMALYYTSSLLGQGFLWGRIAAIFFGAIFVGFMMKLFFNENKDTPQAANVVIMADEDHTDGQILSFFLLLILFMITSTGIFDGYINKIIPPTDLFAGKLINRIYVLLIEILAIVLFCRKYFLFLEVKLWLKKSLSLFMMIIPKIIAGVFVCGIISKNIQLTSLLHFFENNSFSGNFISSIIGALMYFGTIVGVVIVDTLRLMGMNQGPAMALLLSGPAISLPGLLALAPIVGKKKTAVFFLLVVVFSTVSGLLFGHCAL